MYSLLHIQLHILLCIQHHPSKTQCQAIHSLAYLGLCQGRGAVWVAVLVLVASGLGFMVLSLTNLGVWVACVTPYVTWPNVHGPRCGSITFCM
jgi:hypothetical protein